MGPSDWPSVYYDRDGDILDVLLVGVNYYQVQLGNGVAVCRDQETDEVVGFVVSRVRKRIAEELADKGTSR